MEKGVPLRVVLGADDEGETVDAVIGALRERGVELEVVDRARWPQVGREVGERVASGRADMGVLFCWTGTGTSMMANKVDGVRAALCWDPWVAEGARRWNDANVLVMSLKRTPPEEAVRIVDAWFSVETPDQDEVKNIQAVGDYERSRQED